MRQVAWFAATPKPLNAKVSTPQVSRGRKVTDKGGELLFPPLPDEVRYILQWWHDIGCTASGGMGGALSPAEVLAWQQGVGVVFNPFEFRVVLALSRAYVAELQAAEKPDCPPPYGTPSGAVNREEVGNRLKNAMMALQKGRK